MTCYHPIEAWQDKTGNIRFKNHQGQGWPLQLPCGKCIGCRKVRVRDWATRCMHESQMHRAKCFATLTYNDEHYTPTLDKDHLQKFLKRLRHHKGPFRYFAAGEYGKKEQRPHWHLLLFGVKFTDLTLLRGADGHQLYDSKELNEIWGKGYTSVGEINYTTAGYVAKYAIKADTRPEKYERLHLATGEITKVQPERGYMSLNPAIGKTWIHKYWQEVYEARDGIILQGGQKIPAPRYYDEELKKIKIQLEKQIKQNRIEEAIRLRGDTTPERLKVRELIDRENHKRKDNLKL